MKGLAQSAEKLEGLLGDVMGGTSRHPAAPKLLSFVFFVYPLYVIVMDAFLALLYAVGSLRCPLDTRFEVHALPGGTDSGAARSSTDRSYSKGDDDAMPCRSHEAVQSR